jgi:hypothetical protein
MAIQQEVHNTQRLVLVKFQRAVTGNPDPSCPDPDERGYGSGTGERGPVIGILQGKTVKVTLRRGKIDLNASLVLKTSDSCIVTVADPASGAVPAGQQTDIQLTGVDGGTDSKSARIEAHFQSDSGPIVGVLYVRVFKAVDVDITPHFVSIGHGSAAPVAPIADVAAIMAVVRAVWVHYGVTFTVGAVQPKTISLGSAGIVSDNPFPGELAKMLANRWPDHTNNWIPNTINVYFIHQIGTGNTLGYGFSRASAGTFHVPNPGILLGDRTAGSGRVDVTHWGNDLAHEIGHFFRLWHPESAQPPNEREDTWSRRELMHNFNLMRGRNPWPANDGDGHPFKFRPRFADAGYGPARRGCFVSIKNLTQLTTDGELGTARGAINSGPY